MKLDQIVVTKVESIIDLAKLTHCDAIHPGYGFLSENSDFANECEKESIVFIGPSSETISIMGNKQRAIQMAKKLDIPVIPGSNGLIHSIDEAEKVSNHVAFPILLKASLGGGGKGIRKCINLVELKQQFENVKEEAKRSFDHDDIYIEKYIPIFQHIEVQMICDAKSYIILGDRNCSIQRNRQKIIEEAPAPNLPESIRMSMYRDAFNICKFNRYSFLEMNTRIQVEHGVTEAITRIDIVKEQILAAAGEGLDISQEDIKQQGYAIESRINAEDCWCCCLINESRN